MTSEIWDLTAMQVFVLLVFVFNFGSVFGWIVEVFYRHFNNPEHKWINPGFCVGPWLPVYGFGLVIVYCITFMEYAIDIQNETLKKIVLFFFMSIGMTIMELIAGIFLEKFFHTKLWDYSNEWLNFKGLICPKFTLFWMLLAAGYYFVIHPIVFNSVKWLAKNFVFSFFVGMTSGVYMIDILYSAAIISGIRSMAKDTNIVVMLEEAKEAIRKQKQAGDEKARFFLFMIRENLQGYIDRLKTLSENVNINITR